MLVTSLDESAIYAIGHAFGYYDYGAEAGLVSLFKNQEAAATYIRGYTCGMLRGGPSLRDRMDKEKKPYIFVGMVCVPEAYQGRGYMRKVMELAFAEGNRLQLPVILDTDAKSKCDRYVHLGMELAGTRSFGVYGTLYDLIKYPDPTGSGKGPNEP